MEIAAMTGAPPGATTTADFPLGISGGDPWWMAFAVFEDVSDHVVEAPGIWRIGADRRGEDEPIFPRIFAMIFAVPGVGFL